VRWLVLVSLAIGCGRLDFNTSSDATAASDTELPTPCMPLTGGETVQQCLDAFANPDAAPDQLVYDCALSCLWGACVIYDATGCTGCACPYYIKSTTACDAMTGECGPPINGNGCLTKGFNEMTWGCTSANGLVFEAACMMRAYQRVGGC
jgi:hypothetical protein